MDQENGGLETNGGNGPESNTIQASSATDVGGTGGDEGGMTEISVEQGQVMEENAAPSHKEEVVHLPFQFRFHLRIELSIYLLIACFGSQRPNKLI